MKTLIILFITLFSTVKSEEVLARVTYYWGDTETSTGAKPTPKKTIAVNPKRIPYGSKVTIPRMGVTYVAQDTGSAVVSRKASNGKTLIIDVYCATKSEADRYIKIYPMYMKIKIHEP